MNIQHACVNTTSISISNICGFQRLSPTRILKEVFVYIIDLLLCVVCDAMFLFVLCFLLFFVIVPLMVSDIVIYAFLCVFVKSDKEEVPYFLYFVVVVVEAIRQISRSHRPKK